VIEHCVHEYGARRGGAAAKNGAKALSGREIKIGRDSSPEGEEAYYETNWLGRAGGRDVIQRPNMKRAMRWAASLVVVMAGVGVMGHGQAQAPAESVEGKWHFVLDTEGGDRTVEPNFVQEGEKVTGKWDAADVKGTFRDGKLDLAFPLNSEEAGPGTLKIRGELKGDTLTGRWEFQDYSGTFKATRAPTNAT
jgi:hypothetical protein